MIAVGIGYNSTARASDIVTLVKRAMVLAAIEQIDRLAIPAFKPLQDSAPRYAAQELATMLERINNTELAAVVSGCVTMSKHTMPGCGHHSVAEASALAAAGPGAKLLLARIAASHVTCALAQGAGDDGLQRDYQ